jgi:ribonuclease R
VSLPSEHEILTLLQRLPQQQCTLKALRQHFKVSAEERQALRARVREMIGQGALVRLRGARYGLPDRQQTLTGVVRRHEDGYGFVRLNEKTQEDVYIPRPYMSGVMHGDRVLVRLMPSPQPGERRRGQVVQVLERLQQTVIGRVEMVGKAYVLWPAEPRLCPEIYIAPKQRGTARSGQIAVAEISSYTLGQSNPHGRILEVLGEANDTDLEMRLILYKYALPQTFPPEVEAAAAAIPRQVQPHDLTSRRDLRRLITFTIDSETARDFDDAVSLEQLPREHQLLGVHIADVSHYVGENSLLDCEAQARGTSVYFPDRVIPMLPARLSNAVCCLQPEVDRLTKSIFIELTANAEVVRYEMVDAVICSQARLTYTRVSEYLDGNGRALDSWNPAIGPVLERMAKLAMRLRHQRLAAGSIDFDLPDTDVVLDNDGKIEKIMRAERNQAHQLIEEFMLLANRTVARHLAEFGVPALYRIHEPPKPEKIAAFTAFVRALGHTVAATDTIRPREVQAVLAAVAETPEAAIVNHLLLRSMQQARYAVRNAGHFGLAFPYYTHFTSPIRRYPDLLVHRLLRDTARAGGMSAIRREYWTSHLPELAEQASACERRAQAAEREVVDLKKAEFMRDKVGQEYNAVITSVTHVGAFVELTDLFVEGLVRLTMLPDHFVYRADRFCLVGQHTGQTYRLGDRVRVRVDSVSVTRRQVDFSLLAKL